MARPGGNPDRPVLPAGPGRPKGSKNRITRERVELELRRIAFNDIVGAYIARKGKHSRDFTLREVHEMPLDVRACIRSIDVVTKNLTAGDDAQDTVVKVTWWDKTKALELCARSLGMLKDTVVHEWDEGQLSRLDDWKAKNRQP